MKIFTLGSMESFPIRISIYWSICELRGQLSHTFPDRASPQCCLNISHNIPTLHAFKERRGVGLLLIHTLPFLSGKKRKYGCYLLEAGHILPIHAPINFPLMCHEVYALNTHRLMKRPAFCPSQGTTVASSSFCPNFSRKWEWLSEV